MKCEFGDFSIVLFMECMADEYGMPPCQDRLNGKTIYFRRVT